jgi:uncharacterized small protein (DUF1192 family)
MSSKIEVTRKLIKQCEVLAAMQSDEPTEHCKKLREILAAPVVERQPVAWMYLERSEDGYEYRPLFSHQKWVVLPDGFYEESPLYTAPPELAELQATIARLTAENERLKGGGQLLVQDRDALQAEIERLKGGHGEAVAVITGVTSRKDLKFQIVILDNQKLHIGTKLYTSQPAPVSAPDGWKLVPIEPTDEMLDVLHDRVLISVDTRKNEANILNDRNWWKAVVESAPNCLDKVKEMNP